MLGYKKKQILLTEGKIDEVIDNYSHSYAIQYAEDSRTQDDIDAEEYILYYEHDVYDAVIDIVKKSEDDNTIERITELDRVYREKSGEKDENYTISVAYEFVIRAITGKRPLPGTMAMGKKIRKNAVNRLKHLMEFEMKRA